MQVPPELLQQGGTRGVINPVVIPSATEVVELFGNIPWRCESAPLRLIAQAWPLWREQYVGFALGSREEEKLLVTIATGCLRTSL